jgi:hypothetical protein
MRWLMEGAEVRALAMKSEIFVGETIEIRKVCSDDPGCGRMRVGTDAQHRAAVETLPLHWVGCKFAR